MAFATVLVDLLTCNGLVDPRLLYDRPFTGIHESGLDGVFSDEQAGERIRTICDLNQVTVLQS